MDRVALQALISVWRALRVVNTVLGVEIADRLHEIEGNLARFITQHE